MTTRNRILFCFVLLAFCKQGLAQSGVSLSGPESIEPRVSSSLSGVVVNKADGQPVSQAVVIVFPRKAAQESIRGARSGADGRFTVPNLSAGKYHVTVERQGYIRQGEAAPTLDVELIAGSNVGDLMLELTPQSAVAGRVTDSVGEPLVDAQVQVIHTHYVDGRFKQSLIGQSVTNDLGEYRVYGIPAGSYLISAQYQDAAGVLGLRTREIHKDGFDSSTTEDYAVTYYPGTRLPEAAVNVRLKPGQVADHIDIRMEMAQSLFISGVVSNLPAGSDSARVILRSCDSYGIGPLRAFTLQGGNRQFVFQSVSQGCHLLRVDVTSENKPSSARREVSVTDVPAKNIVLDLQPAFEIDGAFALDRNAALPDGIQLYLDGTDRPFKRVVKIKADGHFEIPGLVADRYSLRVSDAAGSVYIKSILMNGQQLGNPDSINIERPTQSLQILLGNRVGQVSGTVVDQDQHAVTKGLVILATESAEENCQYVTPLNTNGGFVLRSLRPGRYRMIFFPDLSAEEEITPETLRKVRLQGEAVNIAEGEKRSITVTSTGDAARKFP